MQRGKREYKRLRDKLRDAGYVADFLGEVQGKVRSFVRLIKPYRGTDQVWNPPGFKAQMTA
jgi:hypothetical protein